MNGRVLMWAGVGVGVVAAGVLAVFWLVQGLEQAGWLAGVLSAFAALAAFVVALLHRPGPAQPGAEAAQPTGESGGQASGGTTRNIFSGGTAAGPVVMGRDISGSVISGGAPGRPPVAPPRHPPAEQPERPRTSPRKRQPATGGRTGPMGIGRQEAERDAADAQWVLRRDRGRPDDRGP